MKATRADDLVKIAAELCHPIADQASVGLDLRFARTTKEAEATPLPFQMRPAAHEPTRLIIEVREFDLQPPFRAGRAFAEDFEDEPGAVDHFRLCFGFEIALLDRRQGTVDDQQFGIMRAQPRCDRFDLAAAEQGGSLRRADMRRDTIDNINPDGRRQSRRFGQPRLHIARATRTTIRVHDDGPRATAKTVFTFEFEATQNVKLFLIIRAFFGKVERMRGLHRRDGMLVNQLHHAIALQQHAEKVISRDLAL